MRRAKICRILTNARCLTEGVDVPNLDAVLFLNPRNSMVDVIQAVGRVMRRAEGKKYGYIILPIAIPDGVSTAQALNVTSATRWYGRCFRRSGHTMSAWTRRFTRLS